MHDHTSPELRAMRPLEIEMIRSAIRGTATDKQRRQLDERYGIENDAKDAFIIKQAASWLKEVKGQPPAARLFGDLWFEHELCILFADTNVGKSILAMQIGDSISRGAAIDHFQLEAKPATVLYCDFELTEQQFRARYSSGQHGDYYFEPNFLRAVINHGSTGAQRFSSYYEFISNSLENSLINTKAKVLIIDNITCLGRGTHAAGSALGLMQHLQALKRKYHLSVLVLAHTPKRNPSRPVSRNDLQGSKMLLNFADSAFAIGESQTEPGLRYLKQIKQRSTAARHGGDNVLFCRIDKSFHMLRFLFAGNGPEASHLMPYTEQLRKQQYQNINRLHAQGLSLRQIADRLGIANSTVHRVLQKLEEKK